MSKPIKNNSQLLYLQARQLFEQARAKFEDGTIKTEPLLVTAVFNSFQEFFTSMGKPNLVSRYAPEEGPPWSEDYNSMMNEMKADLELLFQEVDILGRSLYSDFNHNMVQHEMLTKQFESVLDKMRDLEMYAGLTADNKVEFGRDDFLNKSKIDYSRIAGTPLEIVDGAVTLPQVSRENVAEKAAITIIAGNRKSNKFIIGTESNGFPGNNTEIHSVTDDVLTNKNYIPTFLGEADNHSDYSTVLDGSPNTWFEFEKVNVREQDKIRVAKNLGWSYQVHENQTIEWAEDPENGTLKLHMQIILPDEKVINQINCNMYTPPNYGAKTAIVKNILVSDGKEAPRSVLPKDKKDDEYSFHFPPVTAKVISILFEQSQKYITDIGHLFYEKKMQAEDNSEYAMDMATKKYKYAPRVDGPMISLEDLGIQVKVSDSTVEADYKLLENEPTSRSIGETINRLTDSVDMETVDMGVEKFEGFRWAIGIRDIEVFSCEYATEGELVTVPFYFERAMDKISLNVNEDIPSVFTSNPSLKYDWLKYFVSIDDGATWHPITPMSQSVISEEQPPKIYTIRTVETSEQRLDSKAAYIESEYPVYSLRMKIVARRPEDLTTEGFMLKDAGTTPLPNNSFNQTSPIVSSYMFNVSTLNDIQDSQESDRMVADVGNIGEEPPLNPGTFEPPIVLPVEESNPLKVEIINKKTEWCSDEEMIIKATIYGPNPLTMAELYINNIKQFTTSITGNVANVEFRVPANTLPLSTITVLVRGYDTKGSAIDSDVINIIDCTDLPEEDKPKDPDNDKLTVVIDMKPSEICECDDLIFYGTAQGPNEIQSLVFSINGVSIDPDDLGTPPEDDPCTTMSATSTPSEATILTMSSVEEEMSYDEFMKIEEFGDWLEEFERREDCGCRNKKKKSVVPQFQMQSTPFHMLQVSEKTFQVTIPYWKLRELEIELNTTFEVNVTARDSKNASAEDTFTVLAKDCEKPLTDENGNPRVRDCLQLESVEVHYFDHEMDAIDSRTIPMSVLPFEGIYNGKGSGITIGWSSDNMAPIIMQTSGYDDSGYSFQIHAVGVHYLDEYDQPKVKWTQVIGKKSPTAINTNKMIGDPTRSSGWTQDIANGLYSTSPSLGGINNYAEFIMDNEWLSKACDPYLPNFDPEENMKPEEPTPDTSKPVIEECNSLKDIIIQFYDEAASELKIHKLDITSSGKDTYNLTTKNGVVSIAAGWSTYFNGPAIQIRSATGEDNVLLTAVGLLYTDIYGDAQTTWAQQLRYKTNGAHYPELAIGPKKEIGEITWIDEDVVNYEQATYIGKQGDMVAYSMDQAVTGLLCEPEKTIDDIIGIDPTSPPDLPRITFLNAPESICFEDPNFTVIGEASDDVAVKQAEWGVLVNDVSVIGPYTESTDTPIFTMDFPINTASLQVGDKVMIYATATNEYNMTATGAIDMLVQNCDVIVPVVSLSTDLPLTSGKYCYADLVTGNAPVKIRVTDEIGVFSWKATSAAWSQTETYSNGDMEKPTDTGEISLVIPVTIPAPVTDAYGRSYIPDSTVTVDGEGFDVTGNRGTNSLTLVFTDCSYDPTPPEPTGPDVPCGQTTTSGGNGLTITMHPLGSQPGRVNIEYDMYGVPDSMDVYYKDVLVASTNGEVYNNSVLTFNYAPTDGVYEVKVVMRGNSTADTSWKYTVNCPV